MTDICMAFDQLACGAAGSRIAYKQGLKCLRAGYRPIRFPAHWCADYSKYRGFLAGGISTASSLPPFFWNTAPPPKL